MDGVRVGIIGYGYWGPNVARNIFDLTSSHLVAIADLKDERLKHAKSLYPGVYMTKRYEDMFDQGLDAVVVATPPATHFPIAKECLEHGLHVLVEKPMTLNSQDAQELIDLADANGLALMTGHTFIYNSAVLALKKYIESGELGEIYYVDIARLNLGLFQRGANVLWDLAPHDISILLYLLAENPISISAQGASFVFSDIVDVAYLNLSFPNKVRAFLHVSWLDPCKVRRVTVVGSKKMAVFNDVETEQKIRIYDKGVEAPAYTDSFGEFECNYRAGDITIPKIHIAEPLRKECEAFIARCANGRFAATGLQQTRSLAPNGAGNPDGKHHCTIDSNSRICDVAQAEQYTCGHDGLRVIRVLEAAQRSLMNACSYEVI
jgi:predicted dehydrogenase